MEVKDVITIIIGLMTGGATVVLAIITWRYVRLTKDYVRLTRDMLEENRQMRLDAQKPEIAIYIDAYTTDYTHVDFYVENIGAGPAYVVGFITDLSTRLDDTRSLEEVPFLRTGIGYLAPGQKRKYHLGTAPQLDINELKQKPPKIAVTYKDSMSQEYKEQFCLNFCEHFGG